MSGLMPPNVLSYEGQISTANFSKPFPPTTSFVNFNPSTLWIDSAEPSAWIMLAKPISVANWMKIADGSRAFYGIVVPSGLSPVTVDANNQITFESTDTLVGIAGASANTADFTLSGSVPTSFVADSGSAIPSSHVLSIMGSGGISTSATGSTVAIDAGGIYSLSPYIVGLVGDSRAQYTSIQSAIDQAITDGASAANPKTIYIKPGTYTENLTGHDGITLFAFGQVNCAEASFNTVVVGSLTLASGQMIVNGIRFTPPSSIAAFNLQAGILNLTFCSATLTGANCFELSTTSDKIINLFYCLFDSSGSSAYFHDDGSNASIDIEDTGTNARFAGALTTFQASTSAITWIALDVGYSLSISASSATFNYIDALGTWFSDGTNPLLTTGASTTGSLQLNQTNVICTTSPTLSLGNSNFFVSYPYSSLEEGLITYSGSTPTSHAYTATSRAGTFTPSGLVFSDTKTGYAGAETITKQDFVHTATGSAVTLTSIPLAAGSSIIIQGMIAGANTGHTDMTGGTFSAMADGTAAALVGSPATTVYATSTGTFAVSFSGGNLLVQVTAPSASAYNWTTTYSYQKILTNA